MYNNRLVVSYLVLNYKQDYVMAKLNCHSFFHAVHSETCTLHIWHNREVEHFTMPYELVCNIDFE